MGAIENVARALCFASQHYACQKDEPAFRCGSWVDCKFSDHFSAQARAAVEAMREPTEAMENAGEELDDWGVPSDPGTGNASALSHWTAMIDEALKEPNS